MLKNKTFHIVHDLHRIHKDQKKYLQKLKIMTATPIREGYFMGNYTMSMISLARYSALLGVHVDVQTIMGATYIEHARNQLANTFWNSDCTHLVFIDADIGFMTNYFFELLLTKKDIVGGLYTKKQINWQNVYNAVQHGVEPQNLHHASGDFPVHLLKDKPIELKNEPQEVLTMPTGFLCISRNALQTYVKAHPDRKTTPGTPGHYGIQFFRAGTITNDNGSRSFDSEDNLFCKDMLKLGIPTYLCPWMYLTHYGQMLFDAKFPDSHGAYIHSQNWVQNNLKESHA